MDTIVYDGITYRRTREKWVDENSMIVPGSLQRILNREFQKLINLSSMSPSELIKEGDKYKESSSFLLAIKFYEEALKDCTENDVRYILPRITSCYRKSNQPEKAIEVFLHAVERYGLDGFSAPLFTSVASAFCDLGEFDKAKKYCDRAYAIGGGKASVELSKVYNRIQSETD